MPWAPVIVPIGQGQTILQALDSLAIFLHTCSLLGLLVVHLCLSLGESTGIEGPLLLLIGPEVSGGIHFPNAPIENKICFDFYPVFPDFQAFLFHILFLFHVLFLFDLASFLALQVLRLVTEPFFAFSLLASSLSPSFHSLLNSHTLSLQSPSTWMYILDRL